MLGNEDIELVWSHTATKCRSGIQIGPVCPQSKRSYLLSIPGCYFYCYFKSSYSWWLSAFMSVHTCMPLCACIYTRLENSMGVLVLSFDLVDLGDQNLCRQARQQVQSMSRAFLLLNTVRFLSFYFFIFTNLLLGLFVAPDFCLTLSPIIVLSMYIKKPFKARTLPLHHGFYHSWPLSIYMHFGLYSFIDTGFLQG